MTDLIDHANTDEIPRILPGEITHVITAATRAEILNQDGGEPTQRIDPDTIKLIVEAPSFAAIPRGDLTAEMPIYVPGPSVGFEEPKPAPVPRPPLPPIPDKLDPETGVNIFGGLGADLPEPDEDGDDVVFRRGCNGGQPFPVAAVVDRAPATLRARWRRGRHAQSAPRWATFLVDAGVTTLFWSALALAAVAVVR